MRLIDLIIRLYYDENFIIHLQLFCVAEVLLIGGLLYCFPEDPELPLFVHGKAVYLLGFCHLIGGGALMVFADTPPLYLSFSLPTGNHHCNNHHWSTTYLEGDCSYTNPDCLPGCYWQPLTRRLLASGEISVTNRTFEFTPWKLRPIKIYYSYKGDNQYCYLTLYRGVKKLVELR